MNKINPAPSAKVLSSIKNRCLFWLVSAQIAGIFGRCGIKKIRIILFIACLFPAYLFVFIFFAQAVSTDKQINTKQDQLDALNKKAGVYNQIIDIKQKQQTTLSSQISLMDSEIQKLEAEINSKKATLDQLNSDINKLNNQISNKEEALAGQKKILSTLMQQYYEDRQQDILINLVSNENIASLLSKDDRLIQIGDKVVEVLNNIQSLRSALVAEKKSSEDKKKDIMDLYYQLEERNTYLDSTKNRKEVLLVQTQGEESKYQKLLSTVEEQKREINQEIEVLEASKTNQVNLSNLPPSKKGYFTYPVGSNISITQGYGKTSFSNHYGSGKHNGVDFGIKYGSVYAAKGGKVINTGNNGKYAYGKWIAIDHGDGLVTLYGHFSKQSVSAGDTVKEGDKIGISGNTGYSTGPHLHFSVFAKNTFSLTESSIVKGLMIPTGGSVNPMMYLK
jgi:murein DD-endopeptidase MepM/ murein hydrolase activator NlpD